MKPLIVAPLATWLLGATALGAVVDVDSVDALLTAVDEAEPGTAIQIAPGRYEFDRPIRISSGITLQGAGVDKTILTNAASWQPAVDTLPDPEVRLDRLDTEAYLIRLDNKSTDIAISDLTLTGPELHGAIFSFGNKRLSVAHVAFRNFRWSGIRTLGLSESKIHDCEFIDAGGKWKRGGQPGVDGGISGGAIFSTWMADSEIANNRIRRTKEGREHGHFGIKGRQAKRCRIHHNTIEVNFSIELPFENDEQVEIDHNVLRGVVSIPKHGGGKSLERGFAFDIHHNYFTTSYAIEFVRNHVRVHHNLFDFDVASDGGNLISGFGKAAAPGPAEFHNNLVSNPGRGVIWINEPYDNLTVRNNHIVARTTATPRREGLFGLSSESDFSSIAIVDNLIECEGQARPLLRGDASSTALIRNNRLVNVADTNRYENPQTNAKQGLEEPLKFLCGVNDELLVDGWSARSAVD